MNQPRWPHQEQAVAEYQIPKRALYWDPRLGKSRAALEALLEPIPVRGRWWERAIIAAPLIVCQIQWEPFLASYGLNVIHGWSTPVPKMIEQLKAKPNGILLVNYDKIFPLRDALRKWQPKALIADECHLLSNPTSNRSKAVRAIAERTPWVRILSGTPVSTHLGNLWNQMACLDDPAKSHWGTWKEFREKFLIMDPYYPSKVVGYVNEAELWNKVRKFAHFVRREDVFGPDSWQPVRREIELPPVARAKYNALAKDWMLEEEQPMGEVRADHRLKRITRLRQLCTGHLPDEAGEIHGIHNAKVLAVEADLGEIVASGQKSLVLHQFRWESDVYARMAAKFDAFVGQINGATPVAERGRILEQFKAHKGPAILVGQQETVGIGIPLHFVEHVLFASQDWSWVEEKQAMDRIYAPGIARTVTHYVCSGTCEEYIEEIVAGKRDMHEAVLQADREELAFGKSYHKVSRIA